MYVVYYILYAFENVTELKEGDALGSFQCSLHHYKSFVHLFNFIGASVRAVHNNKTARAASFLLCSLYNFAWAGSPTKSAGGSHCIGDSALTLG